MLLMQKGYLGQQERPGLVGGVVTAAGATDSGRRGAGAAPLGDGDGGAPESAEEEEELLTHLDAAECTLELVAELSLRLHSTDCERMRLETSARV
ncbi:hypothetical protein PRIPAC_74297 [Pristionchus pacificus]|uniref:Uncharacterized protein n=1 Tax=Pristionchus pacificus TaxID=54126 RepID=A0A2A6C974_PRIPA|nr:hypothetical protein PRIPAC_74297 [Pristionchus pacificus]|eukprot:PDM74656.1 hypothetical protein PRIPAC_42012 [Pristionchus pacificus]